ncbi:MAG: hypothetical protein KatS3mg110_2129 [Pirellulaceae bacterium]|nr:MAG: hypothetical protein KatS3mg110_2129 [Pirellulaceae bacterium]
MQVKTLVLVFIAMICGLVATMGISQVMQQQASNRPVETVKVFVAATDIDIGSPLNAQNVKLEEWPKDRVPDGAVTKLEDLEGRFARQRLYPGEPILFAKLMDSNSDTAMTIPEGYRACSIKVSGEIAVGNLVKPGDRVDVIVFLHKSQDIPITSARTILRDVRVWAVNEKTERSVDDMGKVTVAQTVSLLVTPKQVELLTLAAQLGELRLSLRRPNDSKDPDDSGMTVEDLLRAADLDASRTAAALTPASPVTTAPAAAAAGSLQGLMQLFTQMQSGKKPPESTEAAAPPSEPAVPRVQFSMLVHSPLGLTRYDWLDEKQLPNAVPLLGQNSPASVPAGVVPGVTSGGPVPAASGVPVSTSVPPAAVGPDAPLDDGLGTKINVP